MCYIKQDKYASLSLYVDDILIAGNDLEFVQTIKGWLSSTFEMKDMGELTYILGEKIHRNRSNRIVALSQEYYIKKILERFNMQDCNLIDTPFARGEYLSKKMGPKAPEEIKKMSNVHYTAIGSLMYTMMCTRPYICYVVGMVSHYQENPRMAHWKAVKRILRYQKGSVDYSLCYQRKELGLIGYAYADWVRILDKRKSTSRYALLLNNSAISWRRKKQTCIALSTIEIKFFSCSIVWLRRIMQILGIVKDGFGLTTVFSDSQLVIAYVTNLKYHGRAKHIDAKNNFI